MRTFDEHLNPSVGPKRILSLDGGGIRGALTLGYLQKIEDVLKQKSPDPKNFRLHQHFDLIGGTSTGSIIASALAIGMSVQEIKDLYFELGGRIFGKKYKWWNIFQIDDFIKASYDEKPLEGELKKVFKEIKLGDADIKTGLCIVAKRADTNSVWPLVNHPKGKYFDSPEGKNKDILLWKAVRASAAAPTYFVPQIIEVGGGLSEAAFVDGGVSMSNNPALQLLMVATLKGFPYQWEFGSDKLSIVSIGTGMGKWERLPNQLKKNHLLNWAKQIPDMLMQDASWQNQIILQWISQSPTAWPIDEEMGNLENDLIGTPSKQGAMISYLRYNTWLDAPSLKTLMGKDYTPKEIKDLVEMSNAASRFELYDIGVEAAKKEINDNHFK